MLLIIFFFCFLLILGFIIYFFIRVYNIYMYMLFVCFISWLYDISGGEAGQKDEPIGWWRGLLSWQVSYDTVAAAACCFCCSNRGNIYLYIFCMPRAEAIFTKGARSSQTSVEDEESVFSRWRRRWDCRTTNGYDMTRSPSCQPAHHR